ncbi:hypothetical protein SESBI_10976 [Sesbania bispinosa]|nr:hypothetical protein SESBI_10976 [Sesbania bispinosa]
MENKNKKREVRTGVEDDGRWRWRRLLASEEASETLEIDRRRELQELEKSENNKKQMKTAKPMAETSFEWQDFTTDIHFRKPHLIWFPSNSM